ncbi:high affinity immunoglobulin epsilon receptor subunit gamma-like [Eucyclogobius newberryi]|uniref:high affinity immunoglobulin epsilon receptor subunit gamma-like n=1 Tax=Eucyclogobius newberryi TaxID=166745 RepID=UPI003B5AA9A8
MESIKSVVLVLLIFLNTTSCNALSVSDPTICYILDGVLILYCIIATVLFLREKLLHQVPTVVSESIGDIYQELGADKNADPYEMLQPFNKRREKKNHRSEAAQYDRGQEVAAVPGTSSSALR